MAKFAFSLALTLCSQLLLLGVSPARAQSTVEAPLTLPAQMLPWVPWVQEKSSVNCPTLPNRSDTPVCVLPGTLVLNVEPNSASFSQQSTVFKAGWLMLPGSIESAWPSELIVNGQAAPILQRDGFPAVWLTPGAYRVIGTLRYARMPERLRLPSDTPLVFYKSGVQINNPERSGEELWLGQEQTTERTEDSLSVQVHRMLSDGVPMVLATKLKLSVSGRAREVKLSPALPAGFSPIALSGDLSGKLNDDGSLSVQLRPGEWQLMLEARAQRNLTSITLLPPGEHWPEQETLSFAAEVELRTLQLNGLSSVDPKQANVPEEWASLPSFLWQATQPLTLVEESRGRDQNAPNRLSLRRNMWLDFSGKGFSIKDQLNGTMVKNWRIGMRAPYIMTRAQSPDTDGTLQPLLVTTEGSTKSTGVEVRSANLQLATSARLDHRSGFSVSGYHDTLESVSIRLNTPPGWALFASSGKTYSSWMDQWHVWNIFAAALCVLAAWRLAGLGYGALMLIYVLIVVPMEGANRSLIMAPMLSLLTLILLVLLLRRLSPSRWQTALRYLGLAALAVVSLQAISTVETLARLALHPQLELSKITDQNESNDAAQNSAAMGVQELNSPVQDNMAPAPPPEPMAKSIINIEQKISSNVYNIRRSKTDEAPRKQFNRYEANSIVQAGSAEPAWNWMAHQIDFSGPVSAEQTMQLWLIPPWLLSLLRLITAGCLILLLLRLLKPARTLSGEGLSWLSPWNRAAIPAEATTSASASVTIGLLAAALLAAASATQPVHAAEFPPQSLLEELERRSTIGPHCGDHCAELNSANLTITATADNKDRFELTLTAHIGARALLPVPLLDSLDNVELRIDGQVAQFSQRSDQGLVVLLERGVHLLQITGNAKSDRVLLSFPVLPKRVSLNVQGWETSGLRDDKLTSSTLDLARLAKQQTNANEQGKSNDQFPPYLRIVRQLSFDLDWRIETVVERLTSHSSGLSVRVPLLVGERPLDGNVQIVSGGPDNKQAFALIALQAGESEARFTSALPLSTGLRLQAPELDTQAEVWTVESSPMWHIDSKGPPLSLNPLSSGADDLRLRFDPLPGEVLELSLTRPAAAPGPAVRIDSVTVTTEPGERASDSTMNLIVASTQGGRHSIQLPENSELIRVLKDGNELTLRLRERLLELPLSPGKSEFNIQFRELRGIGFKTTTPQIDLKLPAANLSLELQVPDRRWLLWAGGPMLGPAVLYWPTLIVLLLVAAGLARSGKTALGFGAWALLGLGLCGFSWLAFALVAVWFLALQWRLSMPRDYSTLRHNSIQLLLIGLSAAAVFSILGGVWAGLLHDPDMRVVGNDSSVFQLQWFADRSEGPIAQGYLLSVSEWVYKLAILAWSLWLALSLLRWLEYAWKAFNTGTFFKVNPKPVRAQADEASGATPAVQTNSAAPLPPPLMAKPSRPEHADAELAAPPADNASGMQLSTLSGVEMQRALAQLGIQPATDSVLLHARQSSANVWMQLGLKSNPPYQALLPGAEILAISVANADEAQTLQLLTALFGLAKQHARQAGNDELWIRAERMHEAHAKAIGLQTRNDCFGLSLSDY